MRMVRNIVILGSTGSIGESTLQVACALPDQIRVVGLAARKNVAKLVEQAIRFHVRTIAVEDESRWEEARALARPHGINVLSGRESLCEIASLSEADTVVCAVVGLAGLRPVLAAIESGKDVALATKEVLVSSGDLVMRRRAEAGVRILPIDSEHSALFQCLQSGAWMPACVREAAAPAEIMAENRIARLILTASGGPFRNRSDLDLDSVTPEQALCHPNWRMGKKVTIDSATMMNKGLEILEAHELFNIPVSRIGVLVHPQSIVHSLVEFRDGNLLAQLSQPDMRFPIQFALTWPERHEVAMPKLNLAEVGQLSFSEPDESRFPCLRLAREAMVTGGTLPAVMNAADEIAVDAFLQGRIRFTGIGRLIETVLSRHEVLPCDSFDAVFAADAWARREAVRSLLMIS